MLSSRSAIAVLASDIINVEPGERPHGHATRGTECCIQRSTPINIPGQLDNTNNNWHPGIPHNPAGPTVAKEPQSISAVLCLRPATASWRARAVRSNPTSSLLVSVISPCKRWIWRGQSAELPMYGTGGRGCGSGPSGNGSAGQPSGVSKAGGAVCCGCGVHAHVDEARTGTCPGGRGCGFHAHAATAGSPAGCSCCVHTDSVHVHSQTVGDPGVCCCGHGAGGFSGGASGISQGSNRCSSLRKVCDFRFSVQGHHQATGRE